MLDAIVLEIRDEVLRGAKPPADPPSHYEVARTMRLGGGRRGGRFYDPDSDACQRLVLLTLDGRRFIRIAICAPPQVGGKTQCGILPPTVRAAIFSRQLVGYALPTLEALDKAWHEKIAKGLHESGYGGHLPKKGPGSKNGRPEVIYFTDPETGQREGGIVFMTGGAFGSTVSVVVVDDADKFQHQGVPDRGAVEDIFHRSDSNGDQAIRIMAGTIEFDEGSLILATIEDSTDTRPWPSCPHCGVHQQLDWQHVVADYASDVSAMASARYRCDACAVLWTEDDRQRAIEWQRMLFCDRGQRVEGGKVVGAASESLTFGLTWSALDSAHPGVSLGLLAYEYRIAMLAATRGDHSLMRKFYRYRLVRPYTADIDEMEAGTEVTWQRLLERSQLCKWGPALHLTDRTQEVEGHLYSRHVADPPEDAIGCAAGVDVQNNRVYPVLVAFDKDGTTYDIAWSYEFARKDHRPWSKGELHALLDRVDIVLHAWSRQLPLVAVGLDTGDFTADLLSWQSGHRGTWFATKGTNRNIPESRRGVAGLVQINDDGLHMLGVDNLRELIHAAYRRKNGAVGAAHIPSGLSNNSSDTAYLKHLCAEKTIIDPKTRKKRLQQGPGRWDWQDARRIAEAMIQKHLHALSRPAPKVINASDWFGKGRRQ